MATLGTFAAGQVLTAAELNELNNVTALSGASQTINNATETAIAFDAAGEVVIDVSNWHSTTVNPSRITVDKDGIYLVTGYLQFNTVGGSGYYSVQLKKNGGAIAEGNTANPTYPSQSLSVVISATANQYFELSAYQTTGGSVGIFSSRCALSVVLLRTT